MPPPISDEKRAAIATDLQDDTKSRNQIARDHDVSPSTVSKIAGEEHRTFDRTQVIHATRAKQADNKSRRAQLAADLLSDAEKLRKQLWEPTTIGAFGGREGDWHTADVKEPPFADKRAILSSVQTAVRSHVELEKVDSTGSSDDAVSMLGDLASKLKQAWEADSAGEPPSEPQAGRVGGDE